MILQLLKRFVKLWYWPWWLLKPGYCDNSSFHKRLLVHHGLSHQTFQSSVIWSKTLKRQPLSEVDSGCGCVVHNQSRCSSIIVISEADDSGVVWDIHIHYHATKLMEKKITIKWIKSISFNKVYLACLHPEHVHLIHAQQSSAVLLAEEERFGARFRSHNSCTQLPCCGLRPKRQTL